jgi:hypothetical protein
MNAWLARLQHDLVKRLLWPARDRRDLGGVPRPGELVVSLTDDEGQPMEPADLWRLLRAEASLDPAALDRFEAALLAAVAAASRGDLDGVLALDGAFRALSSAMGKDA